VSEDIQGAVMCSWRGGWAAIRTGRPWRGSKPMGVPIASWAAMHRRQNGLVDGATPWSRGDL